MEFILSGIIALMPYGFLGEGFSSALMCLFASIYILINKKHIHIIKNKNYFILSFGLIILGLISFTTTKNLMSSVQGFTVYLNFILYYIVFNNKNINKRKIIKYLVIFTSVLALISIVTQGILSNERISGNISYANTYGLMLLVSVYLINILKDFKFYWIYESILVTAILYTGSRNTYIYLGLFVLLLAFKTFKKTDNECKRDNILYKLTPIFLGLFSYIILESLKVLGVIILPILFILVYFIYENSRYYEKKHMGLKGLFLVSILSIMGAYLILVHGLFSERLRNISLNAGELQERFVYFEDIIRHILDNPLGSGINSFEYSQFLSQSAFYDVRYVHNSVLQVGNDIGILGLFLFVAIFIFGLIIIMRSNRKIKNTYIALYLTIYAHSLLDFDLSYAGVYIIIALLLSSLDSLRIEKIDQSLKEIDEKNNLVLNEKEHKVLLISCSVTAFISLYIIINSALVFTGNLFMNNKDYNNALKFYNLSSNISYKNPETYSLMAESYRGLAINTGDKGYYEKCVYNLEKAHKINNLDPRIIGNLAFSYEELGNFNKAEEYYKKFLQGEKFYFKIYKVYFQFLEKRYEVTGKKKYLIEIEDLKNTFKKNKILLNSKAKYLKNQLPNTFEEILLKE